MKTKNKISSYEQGLESLRTQLREVLPEDALRIFDNDAQSLESAYPKALQLNVGDKAPDFKLQNARGEYVQLYTLLKHHRVILSFYRGGWCPYCNLQLGHYQGALDQFAALGAQLVAVSPQTPDNSLTTKEKNALEFQVLSDPGNKVARNYVKVFNNSGNAIKAMEDLGIDFYEFYADNSASLPVPAVFIIEKNGAVSFARSNGGDYRNRVEASTILEALES